MFVKYMKLCPREVSTEIINNGRLSYNEDAVFQALKQKLTFLARGQNNACVIAGDGDDQIVLRVSSFKKQKGIDSVIIDVLCCHILNKNNIPGFVRVYGVAETTNAKLTKLTNIKNRPVVFAMEKYDSDLTSFLLYGDYDDEILRAVIFQVLYSLRCALKHLKNFRHNDLSPNNIFIKLVREGERHVKKPMKFSFQTDTRTLRTSVYTFIGDFEFVCAQHPGFKNERVPSKRNRSYDTNYFLYCMSKIVSRRFPKSSVVEWISHLGIRKPHIVTEKPSLFVEALMADKFFKK